MKTVHKLLGIFISLALLLSISGCSKKHVYHVKYATDSIKKVAERVVEVIDEYLDYNIDMDEMMEQLDALYERIGGDYEKFDFEEEAIDHSIAFELHMLANYAKYHTDEEILESRDIIAANSGLATTGSIIQKTYSVYDDDNLLKQLDLSLDGASYISLEYSDDSYDIFIRFDVSHGYSAELVQVFFDTLIQNTGESDTQVLAGIEYYEQPMAYISFYRENGEEHINMVYRDLTEDDKSNSEEDKIWSVSDIITFLDFDISK